MWSSGRSFGSRLHTKHLETGLIEWLTDYLTTPWLVQPFLKVRFHIQIQFCITFFVSPSPGPQIGGEGASFVRVNFEKWPSNCPKLSATRSLRTIVPDNPSYDTLWSLARSVKMALASERFGSGNSSKPGGSGSRSRTSSGRADKMASIRLCFSSTLSVESACTFTSLSYVSLSSTFSNPGGGLILWAFFLDFRFFGSVAFVQHFYKSYFLLSVFTFRFYKINIYSKK